MHESGIFGRFARLVAHLAGRPATFLLALTIIAAWGITGPIFGYSDTWQLIINTSTTIITFLMVFVIQNTQNKDSQAIQLKLDELIRAVDGAHNALLNLEDLSEDDLARVKRHYLHLAQQAKASLGGGGVDTDSGEDEGPFEDPSLKQTRPSKRAA